MLSSKNRNMSVLDLDTTKRSNRSLSSWQDTRNDVNYSFERSRRLEKPTVMP